MPEAALRFALQRALSDKDIRRHAHELIFP
jgi:hypothetical protein